MKKRWYSSFLAAALSLSLVSAAMPPAQAAELQPQISSKKEYNTFNMNGSYDDYALPIHSYLFDDGEGITRVEFCGDTAHINGAMFIQVGDTVVVEEYTPEFKLKNQRYIQNELEYFGGFYAGADYNFLIFAQDNNEKDDGKEVFRVVKYSKDWQRLGHTSITGGESDTTLPFDAGSLRCAEADGVLYIYTCHTMYNGHQKNLTMILDQETMEVYESNAQDPSVSHSFNQFILVDADGRLVTLDHGDGHPRALVIHEPRREIAQGYFSDRSRTLVHFAGVTGENYTGCSLGGFAQTSEGYVFAYNQKKGLDSGEHRQIYLGFVEKDFEPGAGAKETQLTSDNSTWYLRPHIMSTGPEGGYILWQETSGNLLYYAAYDAKGNAGPVQTVPGARLSDCTPIPYANGLLWYATDESGPIFYYLSENGLVSFNANPLQNTPSTWAVEEVQAAENAHLIDNRLVAGGLQQGISRDEFSMLMVTLVERATGKGVDQFLAELGKNRSKNPFTDNTTALSHDVAAAYALGIVNGTGDGTTFSPANHITRQEAAAMLARTAKLLGVSGTGSTTFTDTDKISPWAMESVKTVSSLLDPTNQKSVMGSTGGGAFSPLGEYSREQAYITALRLLHCVTTDSPIPEHTFSRKPMPTDPTNPYNSRIEPDREPSSYTGSLTHASDGTPYTFHPGGDHNDGILRDAILGPPTLPQRENDHFYVYGNRYREELYDGGYVEWRVTGPDTLEYEFQASDLPFEHFGYDNLDDASYKDLDEFYEFNPMMVYMSINDLSHLDEYLKEERLVPGKRYTGTVKVDLELLEKYGSDSILFLFSYCGMGEYIQAGNAEVRVILREDGIHLKVWY